MRAKVIEEYQNFKRIMRLMKAGKKEEGKKYACLKIIIWMKMNQDLIMMMKYWMRMKNFIMIIMMKTSLTALVTLSNKGKIQEFYIKIIREIFKMKFQIIIIQIIE